MKSRIRGKNDKEGKSLPWKEESVNAQVRRRQLWNKEEEENKMKMEKGIFLHIVPLSMLACFSSYRPQCQLPPGDLGCRGTAVWNWIPSYEFWIGTRGGVVS
jgi:hypothetical protein